MVCAELVVMAGYRTVIENGKSGVGEKGSLLKVAEILILKSNIIVK